MQGHSMQTIEPQVGSPVGISSTQNPEESREKFNELVRSCAYQLYVRRGCRDGHALEDWLEAEAKVLGSEAQCPVGFIELNDVLDVEASVGNFRAEDLEVSVDPFRLIISGDRGKTDRAVGRARTGQEPCLIFKILDLPVEVDPCRATAKLNSGMLHVVLPKKTQAAKADARAKAA